MVPEAAIEETEAGLAPAGGGWFVLNAREARWRRRPGRGYSLPFTGWTDEECETYFAQVGIGLVVLGPGEPKAALRHGAGVEQETTDAWLAYARFPKTEPTRYRDGWLPSS